MFFAKIPIPVIIYGHPVPWIYLLTAVAVLAILIYKISDGGMVDPMIGGPALVFLYASYHMVGEMFTGFGPIFFLGAIGTFGAVGFVVYLFRSRHVEHTMMVAGEPERLRQLREDGIINIVNSLGCSREQAESYMDRFGNDDTRVLMEARAGRLEPSSGGQSQETTITSAGSPSPGSAPAKIAGSPFNQNDGFALLHASSSSKDYAKWGKMLASVCDILPFDAVQKMKNHRGAVVLTDLREEVADSFKQLLEQDGLEVIKIPVRQMMKFASMGQVKALTYNTESIQIVNHSEEAFTASSAQLMLLTVGLFGEVRGMPDDKQMVDARGAHVGADLFLLGEEDNLCYQFALDLSRLTYAHLGDRMANNGLTNLRLTIGDLVEAAPHMALNSSVKPFVENGRARHFRTSQDYGGEVTGLAQLVRARQLLQ